MEVEKGLTLRGEKIRKEDGWRERRKSKRKKGRRGRI